MLSKYLNPQNDTAFKKIFGSEKNKDILIAMLNAVLKNQFHKPIQDVQFLKTIQDPEVAWQKQSIVDVLCKDKDGCQYIIEMQVADTGGFQKRAQYYASRAFVNQMEKGEDYKNLKKVIFLAFTNFSVFPKKNDYKSEHITVDKKTSEHDLGLITFTFVDLPKFKKELKKELGELTLEEKFYFFLCEADDINKDQFEILIKKHKIIEKAFDALDFFYWTEEEKNLYDQNEKRKRDNKAVWNFSIEKANKIGEERGVKIGEEKTILKLAKKMLSKGEDIAKIVDLTGLSFDVVKNLSSS